MMRRRANVRAVLAASTSRYERPAGSRRGEGIALAGLSGSLRATGPPHEPASDPVHDHSDDEQPGADGHERGDMEISRRLAELVRDLRRHRVTRLEERRGDLVPVADHHGDGHRFAKRAAQPENDPANYS